MCIRDSALANPKIEVIWDTEVLDMLGEDKLSGLSLKNRKTCLLYTSDAADDLLCVDLGGRRIIKKKNYTTITQ